MLKYNYILLCVLIYSTEAPAHNLSILSDLAVSTKPGTPTPEKISTNSKYDDLKIFYNLGLHKEAISEATSYLQRYPEDVDVRYLLGTFYYHAKDYASAQIELIRALQQTPNYSDVSLLLIHIKMANHQYQEALNLANESLIFDPLNAEILAARLHTQTAINSIKPPSLLGHEDQIIHHTLVKKKRSQTPENPSHKNIYPADNKEGHTKIATDNEDKKYLNEIGITQQNYYISDVRSIWDYSTVYYGRDTSLGKLYGKLNYANRLGQRALQGEIEAYPQLNKYVYLDVDYAFANDPNLFPNKSYGIEAYVTTKKAIDFSIGGKYNNVDPLHQFTVYTGSITRFLDNYKNMVTFRPYFFKPGTGPGSTLYTLNVRHTITDPYFYFGCSIGAGTSPDLASLTTVNFLVTQNKIINPYLNFPLFNERLIVKLGVLFQNQVFNSLNKVRNWSGGTMNLAWKF